MVSILQIKLYGESFRCLDYPKKQLMGGAKISFSCWQKKLDRASNATIADSAEAEYQICCVKVHQIDQESDPGMQFIKCGKRINLL